MSPQRGLTSTHTFEEKAFFWRGGAPPQPEYFSEVVLDRRDYLLPITSYMSNTTWYIEDAIGQKKRFSPIHTVVHCRPPPPRRKSLLRLGFRRHVSNTTSNIPNATWYVLNGIGGKLSRPGPTETLSGLSFRGTLRTRADGRGHPSPKFRLRAGIRRYISNTTS